MSQFNNPVRRDGNRLRAPTSSPQACGRSQFNNPVRRDGNWRMTNNSTCPSLTSHNSIIPFAGMETKLRGRGLLPVPPRHNSIIPFAGMETPSASFPASQCRRLSQFNNPVRRDGNLEGCSSLQRRTAWSQFNNPVRRD